MAQVGDGYLAHDFGRDAPAVASTRIAAVQSMGSNRGEHRLDMFRMDRIFSRPTARMPARPAPGPGRRVAKARA